MSLKSAVIIYAVYGALTYGLRCENLWFSTCKPHHCCQQSTCIGDMSRQIAHRSFPSSVVTNPYPCASM